MNTPAAMKKGMAMIGKLSMEVKLTCAMYSMGRVSAQRMVARVASPRLMATGTPMAQSRTKYPKRQGRGSRYPFVSLIKMQGEAISAAAAKPASESYMPQTRHWAAIFCTRRRLMSPNPRGRTR